MTEEATTYIDWTHSEENQGHWLRKTMVSLWFMTDMSKGQMVDVLKIVQNIWRTRIAK